MVFDVSCMARHSVCAVSSLADHGVTVRTENCQKDLPKFAGDDEMCLRYNSGYKHPLTRVNGQYWTVLRFYYPEYAGSSASASAGGTLVQGALEQGGSSRGQSPQVAQQH